ncbi:hypothetical protein A4A49_41156 [Nicotiana attenuata]|uniref:Uncharacterized protein n=1 Tax=Nicotiana attenuata TaxID=49451 RepID=A0A1J6JNT7_NICAT|nr:hypothetical protein A4A49_41156 [Nicotiana attenuata]
MATMGGDQPPGGLVQTGKELVPVRDDGHVQTSNQFAILEGDYSGDMQNNQLAVVEEVQEISLNSAAAKTNQGGKGTVQNQVMRNTRTSPRSSGKLNAAATVFDPNTTRKEATKEGLSSNPSRNTNKEFTAQWVNRAFLDPNVTTNQSCQEIPSQSLYTSVIPEQENLKDRVNFIGGRLWCQQHEEESYEGEFLEGHEDVEEVHVEDPDVEEQSVNGKRDRSEVQGVVDGINAKGATDQPLQLDQYHINPNSLSIPNQESSSVEKQDPIAQPKDPGDPEDPGDNSAAIQHQQLEGIQKGGDLKLQQNQEEWELGLSLHEGNHHRQLANHTRNTRREVQIIFNHGAQLKRAGQKASSTLKHGVVSGQ